MKPKIFIKTFGCRTNQFDSQLMLSYLNEHPLASSDSDADVVVVNSCTVTNSADATVRNYIRSLKRRNPNAKVLLAGCGAHSQGKSLFESELVFGVMGHSLKSQIASLVKKESPFFEMGNLNSVDRRIITDFVGKSRAFVKVQEGCDFSCSYCIIPAVRGAARSLDERVILEQIATLSHNGFNEFILTGTNLGSYGVDTGSSLAALLKKISAIRGVKRVRLGSLEPSQIDEEFMEILDEPWMAKHLHIALQHSSNRMLEIMNRLNRFEEDLALFEKLASRGYALGSDFIVGHPGESEAIWQEAFENIKHIPLTHIHTFVYSKRSNTQSALMSPSIHGDIARSRQQQLNALIEQNNYQFRKRHCNNLEILVESSKEGLSYGFDQYYNKIAIQSSDDLRHQWIFLEQAEARQEGNFGIF